MSNLTAYFRRNENGITAAYASGATYGRHRRDLVLNAESFHCLVHHTSSYLRSVYNRMNGTHLAIATAFVVVLLSFLIPDISKKLHATNELKTIKNAINQMSREVVQAEVACLTAADEICYLQCSMQDSATDTPEKLRDFALCSSQCSQPPIPNPATIERRIEFFKRVFLPDEYSKEVTIMSYIYTDSFDVKKTIKPNTEPASDATETN